MVQTVEAFLGALLRDMVVDCCIAQSNKNMIERRRWCVACLRILLGTAAGVSDDPRPEARTARGSIIEIHVFTDFSKALTLKLRTRRIERSSCRVSTSVVLLRCCVYVFELQAESSGKLIHRCPGTVQTGVSIRKSLETEKFLGNCPVQRMCKWKSCSLGC